MLRDLWQYNSGGVISLGGVIFSATHVAADEFAQQISANLDAKLANEQFTSNAPPAIVRGAEARRDELRARLETLKRNR